MMVVVLLLSGLAIDVAIWYQHHHQAQVAADSAALAAANCLANEGVGNTCTSVTDTTDATAVAVQFAGANGVTISSSQVSYNSSTNPTIVTVTAPDPSPISFAGIANIGSSTQVAKAAATWTAPAASNACTAAAQQGGRCDVAFAADQSCSNSADGVQITGGSGTINGPIWSDSNFTFTGGSTYTFNSTVTYGNGSGCAATSNSHAIFNDGNPAPQAPIAFPTNYANDFPACGGSGQATCTGPCDVSTTPCPSGDKTPSYCGYATTGNVNSVPVNNAVLCLVGNQGTASQPATYNGTFSPPNSGSYTITVLAGQFNISGGSATLTAYSHNLLAYATQADNSGASGSPAISVSGGTNTLTGDLFAPTGLIKITGGSSATTTFLEGYDIDITGGSFSGDGPTLSGQGTFAPGADSLIQ